MSPAVHDYGDKLLDLAYGELQGNEASQLEAHVLTCTQCTEALQSIRGVRKTMAQLPPPEEPDAGLESLLAYAEQSARRSAAGPAPAAGGWRKWLAPVLGFTAVAALALVLIPISKESSAPSAAQSVAAMKMEDAKAEKLAAKELDSRAVVDVPPAEQQQLKAPVVIAAQPTGKSADLRMDVQGDNSKAIDGLLAQNEGDGKEAPKRELKKPTATPDPDALAENKPVSNSANLRGGVAAATNGLANNDQGGLKNTLSQGYGKGSAGHGQSAGSGGGLGLQGSTSGGGNAGLSTGRTGGGGVELSGGKAVGGEVALDDNADGERRKEEKPADSFAVTVPSTGKADERKLDSNKDLQAELADKKQAEAATKVVVAEEESKQKAHFQAGPMEPPPPPQKKAKTEETRHNAAPKAMAKTEAGYDRDEAEMPAAVAQESVVVTSTDSTKSRAQYQEEQAKRLHEQYNALSAQAWDARKKKDRGLEIVLLKQALALGISGQDLAGALNRLCETEADVGNIAEAQNYCQRAVREFPNTGASQVAQRKLLDMQQQNAVYDAPGQHSPAAPVKAAPMEKSEKKATTTY